VNVSCPVGMSVMAVVVGMVMPLPMIVVVLAHRCFCFWVTATLC
jgi:hypothetical protein